jgi:branched-subunit amino acid ABC-type transport system permease component
MQSASPASAGGLWQRYKFLLLALPIAYIVLLLGQPAGFDIPKIVDTIRQDPTVIVQQLINGLATGAIIAIIALGYTLVYGIIELVNFANGDVFMLGAMVALLALSPFIVINANGGQTAPWWAALLGFIPAMAAGALLNWGTERIAYRRLRNSPKLVILISAIGMSFILQNVGLQLASFGKLANLGGGWSWLNVLGTNNAAPKSFPAVLSDDNLLDYIIPPPPAPTAGPQTGDSAVAPAVPVADTAATSEALIALQITEEAMAAATAAAGGADTGPDAQPTLDPTQAAEETAISATTEAEYGTATPSPGVEAAPAGEATPEVPTDSAVSADAEPTLDATQAAEETAIIATTEAEYGTATPEAAVQPTPDLSLPEVDSGNGTDDTGGTAAEAPAPTNKIRITAKNLMVIVVASVLMLALNWFVNNTRLGKAMRATAQNRAAAQIMGINIDNIISLTFIIGGALAGAAGMMSGIYNGTVVFTMGFTAGLRSFTAAVLGGIGNIRGAALGGFLIGIVAAFSDQFLSVRWTNAWVFLILVLVLIFRPTGLLGSDGGEKA